MTELKNLDTVNAVVTVLPHVNKATAVRLEKIAKARLAAEVIALIDEMIVLLDGGNQWVQGKEAVCCLDGVTEVCVAPEILRMKPTLKRYKFCMIGAIKVSNRANVRKHTRSLLSAMCGGSIGKYNDNHTWSEVLTLLIRAQTIVRAYCF